MINFIKIIGAEVVRNDCTNPKGRFDARAFVTNDQGSMLRESNIEKHTTYVYVCVNTFMLTLVDHFLEIKDNVTA